MLKLKSTHYFILLLSSLILGIVYLNKLLSSETSILTLTSPQTGAISAVPITPLPHHYAAAITLGLLVMGYLLWVWAEADKLKTKYKK